MSSTATEARIRLLPPQVANQIAAGEVVERPASVVKELLENCLDAGAHAIEVDIERGGVHLIRIRDDGHGIHRDDLPLALSPHATSKITRADDLEAVSSLGFRGEALASIASVSRLVLSSRRADCESGWQLGDGTAQPRPVALSPGTEVEVRDLFFNTPARRKFLRSERTEFTHVEEVVRRIALSRADLALRLTHNGKQLLRVKPAAAAGDGGRRVAEVLGKPFLDNSASLDVSAGALRLWGWLGHAGYSRGHADTQYVYLNGRMIRDRLVAHAVRLAFGARVPEGRFPAYLLYLELDPHQVDVNVHPTKHEVRFREARQVHDFIYWAISGALNGTAEAGAEAMASPALPATSPPAQGGGAAAGRRPFVAPLRPAVAERAGYYGPARATGRDGGPAAGGEPPLGRALLQLASGYLLAERSDATVLVDLRAVLLAIWAHRLADPAGRELLTPQPLLIPESVALRAEEAQRWRERGALLEPYGFDWGWLGEGLLVVRGVPALVRTAPIAGLVAALGGWLADGQGTATEQGLLALLAAHAVAEPLPAYSLAELNTLLRDYERTMPHAGPLPWRLLGAGGWRHLFELLP